MPVLKLVRGAAVVLAAVGIVMPMPSVQAADSRPTNNSRSATVSVADVKLASDAALKGRVVDYTGSIVKHAQVVVRQGNKEVASSVANEAGVFSIKGLKPGSYQISSGTTEGTFRVWREQAAPPAAHKNALLVLGEKGARGQFGGYDAIEPDLGGLPGFDPTIALLTAGVIAGVVVSSISLAQINSTKSKVNDLQGQLNQIQASISP